MPRTRSIKPSFFTDADLCEQPPLHRILFEGLWCHSDRDGRLEDKPRELKVMILPYDPYDIDAALNDLHRGGFIRRYSVETKRYIQVVKFADHQRPHKDEKPSVIPQPPPDIVVEAVPTPVQPGTSTESAPPLNVSKTPGSCFLSLGPGSLVPGASDLPQPAEEFRLVAEPEAKKRKRSEGQKFFDWTQPLRKDATGLAREKEPEPAVLNTRFAEMMAEAKSLERLQAGYIRYLQLDTFWIDKRSPFNGFVSSWRDWLPAELPANARACVVAGCGSGDVADFGDGQLRCYAHQALREAG